MYLYSTDGFPPDVAPLTPPQTCAVYLAFKHRSCGPSLVALPTRPAGPVSLVVTESVPPPVLEVVTRDRY